jgi:hypothetical protein
LNHREQNSHQGKGRTSEVQLLFSQREAVSELDSPPKHGPSTNTIEESPTAHQKSTS